MKVLFPVLLVLACFSAGSAQPLGIVDTLLLQTFTIDPSDTMLFVPTGNDLQWVNWDGDELEPLCGQSAIVPGNWFWESDLGDPTFPPTNFAFTSCAYLADTTKANQNWLITPPVFIPDSTVMLSWRSLPLEGPGYLDGYKVLVSTGSNEPFINAFTDTLFVAAEMDTALVFGSLDPNDYIFTPGYVHADRYTKTDYFYLAFPKAGAYSGKFEPHSVSLAQFTGKSIYIAFLHDSTNGSLLQIDDIAVLQGQIAALPAAPSREPFFRIEPNPANRSTAILWELPNPMEISLILTDRIGRTVQQQRLAGTASGYLRLDVQALPAGIYFCTLRTDLNQQTQLLVKQ